jgi:hypothetical protein
MDWPIGEQTATVLASSGGDASLYTTGTFGIIGGIGHEHVKRAAGAFVAAAKNAAAKGSLTKSFPYPDRATVRFYFVTPEGVRTLSFSLKSIETDSTARSLFGAAQDVVTGLRQITESREPKKG